MVKITVQFTNGKGFTMTGYSLNATKMAVNYCKAQRKYRKLTVETETVEYI